MVSPHIKRRLEALEQGARSNGASIADRLKRARERWRALSPDQQQAERDALLAKPEPLVGTLRHRLWLAARRVAALRPTNQESRLHG